MNRILTLLLLLLICAKSNGQVDQQKTLIDFFLPMESKAPLVSEGVWGDQVILPRDTTNGLEDATLKNWCYWDGGIVKDDEGKYHMYASRWSQAYHHGYGWNNDSKAIHAVSDDLWGPYKDLGLTWPQWNKGAGHNVIGLRMRDGRYAMVASEVVPGQVFVSDSPNGSFKLLGNFKIDPNGYYPGWARYNELDDGAVKAGVVGNLANVMIILRPDGRYMMMARHCVTMISDDGILGPYKMMSDKAWLGVEGLPQFKMEDPTVWYSDGLYHIVVNHYGGEVDATYHLTSEDGISNWKNRGFAYKHGHGVFRHPNGVREDWYTVQRPTVYTEDDRVRAFNFSVIDVQKGKDDANDENGSKIIVIPFDGKAFGKHIRTIVDEENRMADNTPPPGSWQSVDIGDMPKSGNSGYDEEVNTIRIKASGNAMTSDKDACRFVYQKMEGDISAKVQVLSHDITDSPVKAGLMIRAGLNEEATSVFASISKEGLFELIKRSASGQKSEIIATKSVEAPYWIRMEKRGNKIRTLISSSNRMNWIEMGEIELGLDEEFYVGMAATSQENKKLSLARFKDVDVHAYGFPKADGILSHTFPDTISSSGVIDFEVEVESLQSLDVWVELQNVQTLEKYQVLRKRFWKSETKKLTYEAGKELDPNSTYWFVIKAVPMHFHDSEHVHSGFKKVFVEK
ncbi:MAG: glycoside hydrolase family protein [Cyclobacteriaceae bacterium]